jgi:uncharacterized phage protein gp47/JayE
VALSATLPAFPASADISTSIQQRIQYLNSLATNFNDGSFTRTFIEAISIALGSDASSLPGSTVQGAYEILTVLEQSIFLTTASDYWLDLRSADFGVYRKTPTSSNVTLIFTSPNAAPMGGTPIAAGTLCQANLADPSASPVIFQTVADVTIPSGSTTSPPVAAVAVTTGSATNVPANAISVVTTGPTSFAVYNPGPATGGTDRESDDDLRARALLAVANASQCTLAALVAAALTYNGITSASYLDLTAADGVTFQLGNCLVFCDDGSGDLGNPSNPNHASLVAFQNDLTVGKWRAAGCHVDAFGSLTLATTVSVMVDVAQSYLNEGYSQASVLLAVQTAIFNLVQAGKLGQPVRLSDIVEVARPVPGVSNVLVNTVLINGAAADLFPGAQYVTRCVDGLSDVTVTAVADTLYS